MFLKRVTCRVGCFKRINRLVSVSTIGSKLIWTSFGQTVSRCWYRYAMILLHDIYDILKYSGHTRDERSTKTQALAGDFSLEVSRFSIAMFDNWYLDCSLEGASFAKKTLSPFVEHPASKSAGSGGAALLVTQICPRSNLRASLPERVVGWCTY